MYRSFFFRSPHTEFSLQYEFKMLRHYLTQLQRDWCSLCHSAIGLCGDNTTAFQCTTSDGNGASIPSLTWPKISFPRIKSCWKTVNCTPKFSSVHELFVATSKLNSSSKTRFFFLVLVWKFCRISSLYVSSTATKAPLKRERKLQFNLM